MNLTLGYLNNVLYRQEPKAKLEQKFVEIMLAWVKMLQCPYMKSKLDNMWVL